MSTPSRVTEDSAQSRAQVLHTGRSRRRLAVVAVVLVVGVAAIIVLATALTAPAPHNFALSIPLNATQDGSRSMSFPNGTLVSGTWTSSNPDAQLIISIGTVLPGNISEEVYESRNSESGSFSFTSAGTIYYFEVEDFAAATTVEFAGSY